MTLTRSLNNKTASLNKSHMYIIATRAFSFVTKNVKKKKNPKFL